MGSREGLARLRTKVWAGLALALLPNLAIAETFAPAELEFFEKRIRPTLATKCYHCHSHEAEKLKAGLYLDSRQGILSGGDSGPAAIPGRPMESRFMRAIEYGDVDLQMPPKSKLSEMEIADLRQWIAQGMPWPEEAAPEGGETERFDLVARRSSHWSWQPVQAPLPPEPRRSEWTRNPVDAFVLDGLEQHQLAPAPEASRRSLIRRLSFLLTGLPPSAEAITAFEADYHPQAYDRVVDDLLASPQFGERWARHWLDLVRYAETMGHEFDYAIPNAWRYRDYLVRALNGDVPYDDFVREHIAGDLLTGVRRNPETGANESVVGTGFYWLGQQVHSPVDIEMNQLDVIDNQIDVLSKTFLGMTVSCARCHDHKFDAISTQDFYAFYGVLSSSRYHEASVERPEVWGRALTRLQQVQSEAKRAAVESWQSGAEQIPELIQAGLDLLAEEGAVREVRLEKPDQLFETFTAGFGDRWEGVGQTFSIASAKTDPQEDAVPGSRFAASYAEGAEARGASKGRLVSQPFTIDRDYLHFLVAGGRDRNRTAVRLLIDGQTIHAAAGRRDDTFRPDRFDLRDHQGREARIELADQGTRNGEFIAADHFVFSDRERVFGSGNRLLPSLEAIEAAASDQSLDSLVLRRWVEALDESLDSDQHPLGSLTRLATTPGDAKEVSFLDRWEALGGKELVSVSPKEEARGVVLADAAKDGFRDWFFDGPAVQDALAPAGDLLLNAGGGRLSISAEPAIHSGRYARRLEGSLRSPTFQIQDRFLHVLAAGEESRVNVVIENFNLIRAPIYGGLKKRLNHRESRWLVFDLEMWQGHEAYLELKDTRPGDLAGGRREYGAEGWFAVHRVVRSNAARLPAPERSLGRYLNEHVSEPDSLSTALVHLGERTQSLIHRWGSGKESKTDAGLTRADYEWLSWLVERDLIPPAADEAKTPTLAMVRSKYVDAVGSIPAPVLVPSMTDGSGVDQVVFVRGNPRMRGAQVERGFLEALGPRASGSPSGSRRRDMAEQIADEGNPLTARVYVNRVWHHVFGRGIVATPDNFGVLGAAPSHPELLDWLADWFVTEANWSTKRLIRLLVTSATYRMASQSDAYYEERDPTNQLWHRMPVRRLEGEAIRDAILQVSGELDLAQFGPSVPVHLTPFMTGRGRPGRSGPLDGERRRSVYQEVRRNFLSPLMLAFDAPVPHTSFGKRTVSNVPAQALILMNDPLVKAQSRVWAERLLGDASLGSDRDRIRRVYESGLGRRPTRSELRAGIGFLDSQRAIYGDAEDADAKVWADFCHVVFNVKEFIFLD